jgi:hypothetical protein
MLVAIVGIASFLAFPLGMARSSPAWSVPVSFFCWSVALLLPGVIVALIGRMRLPQMVAQVSLTALFWNVAVWCPVPAYRMIALVVVPLVLLFATVIIGRMTRHDERLKKHGRSWSKVLGACAWNSLFSLALFLAIAYVLNAYGYVRSR